MTARPLKLFVVVVVALVAGCLLSGNALAARTNVVSLSGTSFSPPSLTNFVGDTVTWTNISGFHNVTCDVAPNPDPVCGTTATANSPWVFSFTYTKAGVYPYRCTIHQSSGMLGTITTLPLPKLTNNVVTNGSQFQFTILKSMPRQTNIIQYSTNLTNWFAIGTNSANASSFSFTNLFTPDLFRFYRVIQQ